MTSFAKIENNLVTNVIDADQAFVDTQAGVWVDLTPILELVGIGFSYDGVVFTAPVAIPGPLKDQLNISLDKPIYAVSELITVTVSVTNNDVALPLTTDYYVPVIRDSDGVQIEFLTVSIVNGLASLTFSLTGKGKYSIKLDKITPTVTAELAVNPSFIVV